MVARRVLALGFLVASCTDAVGDQPRVGSDAADAGASDAAPSDASAAPARGAIRVATFNVHRLFDTVCDSGDCSAGAFEEVTTQAALDARIVELAAGIAKLDADAIALEEVEDEAVFAPLRDRLATLGLGYVTAELGETGAPASMDVAIFARGAAPAEIRRHRDDVLTRPDGTTTTFSRELLEARFMMGDHRVIFFAAHFRSKVDDDPGRRYAEAVRTREIMTAASADDPSALVVLAGDLNDTPDSEPMTALAGGGALVRVAQDLPLGEQSTFAKGGRAQALDHVFVTANGAPRYVAKSCHVAADVTGSDHFPLRCDFD